MSDDCIQSAAKQLSVINTVLASISKKPGFFESMIQAAQKQSK